MSQDFSQAFQVGVNKIKNILHEETVPTQQIVLDLFLSRPWIEKKIKSTINFRYKDPKVLSETMLILILPTE